MPKGHTYGIGLLLIGLFVFALFVVFSIGPIKGYLIGSVGLIIMAVGMTIIMNEEGVNGKFILYTWFAIFGIIGLLLGINYFGISIPKTG
jgi:hypothetical protein